MKKLIVSFFLVVLVPILSYAETQLKTETPLLPEVKKILEVPPINEKEMEQNAYVYLITFDATDDNYLDLAKNYLVKSNQWLIQSLRDLNSTKEQSKPKLKYDKLAIAKKINGEVYRSPCRDISNFHCVEDTLKLQQQLTELIDKNKKILERYEHIISLPNYHTYNELEDGYFANYGLYSFLSDLKLFQSIDLINQGNIPEGLDILNKEIDFAQKIYASKSHFISKSIARKRLLTIYNTISGLIDNQPKLMDKTNYVKLTSLLNTLPNQGLLNLDTMLVFERDQDIYSFVLSYKDMKTNLQGGYFKQLIQLANDNNILLTFDYNKTLNKFYQIYQSNIQLANSSISDKASAYFKIKQITDPGMCSLTSSYAKEFFLKVYDKDNVIGDYILCENRRSKSIANSIYTLFDVQNYLALINLKLETKKKMIKVEQIPEFLIDSRSRSINPYTKTPFMWNKEKLEISTDFLRTVDSYSIFEEKNDLTIVLSIK